MATQCVTLMCYWNGRIVNGPQGISYEGAAPKPIRVNYGITHIDLLDKIYKVTGFEKEKLRLKIICRYPACREYIPVPIDDDESVDIMFDVARQPGTNCMELYIDKEPTSNTNQVDITTNANGNHPRSSTPIHSSSHVHVTRPTSSVENQDQISTEDSTVDDFLDPGPIDKSVLVLQNEHRSEVIWAGEDRGVLTCRQRLGTMMREWPLDNRICRFVIQSGFYGVYKIGFIQIDWPLITALVERWRQETHTFHFTVGEATVTLQDVAVLLGLQINGHAVSGKSEFQWDDLCEELLGVRPDRSVLRGSALKHSWLRTHFREPPPECDDLTLQQYARAYILGLMGAVLFTDKSGADVQLIFLPLLRDLAAVPQFSWGSAVLANLYRELCRACKKGANEIAGPLSLLQLWAWERLSIGRPERLATKGHDPSIIDDEETDNVEPLVDQMAVGDDSLPKDPLGCWWRGPVIRRDNPHRALVFYRDQLDQQTNEQMIWQPYTSERLAILPDVCLRDRHLWQTVAPLICFDVIEWHRPDRVLRQFGLRQGIPMNFDTELKLHAIDRRGRHHYDWRSYHGIYIRLWNARKESVVLGETEEQPMQYHDPYLKWYRSITRRMITPLNQRPHKRFQPSSGTVNLLVQSLTAIHNQCTATLGAFETNNAMKSLNEIQTMCIRVLQIIGERRHIDERHNTVASNRSSTTMQSSSLDAHKDDPSLVLNHGRVASSQGTIKGVSVARSLKGRGRGRSHSALHVISTSVSPSAISRNSHTQPESVGAEGVVLRQNHIEATPVEHKSAGLKDVHKDAPLPVELTGMNIEGVAINIVPLEGERETECQESIHFLEKEEELCTSTPGETDDIARIKKKRKSKNM